MSDLSARTLRELLTLARERFGPGAANLKTRAELIAALSAPGGSETPAAAGEPPPAAQSTAPKSVVVELVTHDFFRRRS
ncbi:MAG: hypothetical protein JNM17_04865 [Archangium sp.]|nr:hypothetical protein [Archangium sp.]